MFTASLAPTQKSVAKASGLSRATVGAILGGGPVAERYSEETRRRVFGAASSLNYRPHWAAKTMRRQRSNLIAIVHFGEGIEIAQKTNRVLSRKLKAAGYDYLAVDMNWHEDSVERTIEDLIQMRVEGVIISHIQKIFEEKHTETLLKAGIPVVTVNGEHRSKVPLICSDIQDAFRRLTQHLLSVGHRRILHLGPGHAHSYRNSIRTISQRIIGFRTAMEEKGTWSSVPEEDFFGVWKADPAKAAAGIEGITVFQDPGLYERLEQPVYQFCKRLFESGNLPDAIVCPNDRYAMEAIAAGWECGVRIPDDVGITGFDNDRMSALPAFGITTAEPDVERLCAETVNAMLKRVSKPNTTGQSKTFDLKLILRTSCGQMKKTR